MTLPPTGSGTTGEWSNRRTERPRWREARFGTDGVVGRRTVRRFVPRSAYRRLAAPSPCIPGRSRRTRDTVERYARAGVTNFIFMTFTPYFTNGMQAFAEEGLPTVRGRA